MQHCILKKAKEKNLEAMIKSIYDTYGTPLLIGLFILLFILEKKFRLRDRTQLRWKRIVTNVFFGLPAFILLRLLFIPALVWIALQNGQWQFGLAKWLVLPVTIEFIIGFLLLDYFIYIWHRLTHKINFIWRFHSMHHTDLDMDITTAMRFHFIELLISLFFRGASVLIIGVSPLLVIVYEIIFEACTNFHHSNLKIPLKIEKLLNLIIVTPRMHGIHHSVKNMETNSNFSTIFSFWDRLHNTFIPHNQAHHIKIGLPDFQSPHELTIWNLFIMPFKKHHDKT